MANVDLEALGIDAKRIEDRVVDILVENLSESRDYESRVQNLVLQRIDAAIEAIALKHVVPNIQQYIEDFALTQTNRWGDKKGEMTFTEYLVKRANDYLAEKLDYDGKTKAESSSSFFRPKNARVVYLIDQHLHYHIAEAMKRALQTINESIAGGLEAAIKDSIKHLQQNLKVAVEVKDRG